MASILVPIFGLLVVINPCRVLAAVGIRPYFEPGDVPQDVVGLRYSTRIDSIKPGKNVVILFGGTALHNPGQRQIHRIEANFYNHWVAYKDTGSVLWPPTGNGVVHRNQGALWISISDYNREGFVGLRQKDRITFDLFPRMNSGIDRIPGITKIESISQQNMVGKDVYIEITRGGTKRFDLPQAGWGGRYRLENNEQISLEELPAGHYQLWNVRVAFDGVEYAWEAAFPSNQAKHVAPHQMLHFVTEFFEKQSKICSYVWNPQIVRQGKTEWENLTKWKRHYQAGVDPYGPRITEVSNRHVLELSNDKEPESYLKKDEIVDLMINPTVQWKMARSSSSKDQEVLQISAVMDRPSRYPVALLVRSSGTAVRGKDYISDEKMVFCIPAGKLDAVLEIPLGKSSQAVGKTVVLTLISSNPAAMAGQITHVVTLGAGV